MRRRNFVIGLLVGVMGDARAQKITRVYHFAFVDPVVPVAEMTAAHPWYGVALEELLVLAMWKDAIS